MSVQACRCWQPAPALHAETGGGSKTVRPARPVPDPCGLWGRGERGGAPCGGGGSGGAGVDGLRRPPHGRRRGPRALHWPAKKYTAVTWRVLPWNRCTVPFLTKNILPSETAWSLPPIRRCPSPDTT